MNDGFLKDFLDGRKYNTDLLLVIVLSLVSYISVLIMPDGHILRIVLGLPLLLVYPGYALVSTLWPTAVTDSEAETKDRTGKSLGSFDRLIISIGLSLVCVAIIGFALRALTDITMLATLSALTALSILFSIIAFALRSRLPETERFHVCFTLKPSSINEQSTADKVFSAILITCIIICATVVIYMVTTPSEGDLYTEFFLTDADGTLASLPLNLAVNETGNVTVYIRNREAEHVEYTILASIDNATQEVDYGVPIDTIIINPAHNIGTNISLADSTTFDQNYSIELSVPGEYLITWELRIDGQATDYELHLWVNVV